jgi:hypothetical protein
MTLIIQKPTGAKVVLKKDGVTTGLLDAYGGAAAAYSLRRLSANYGEAVVRVRRSSDNTEQDFTTTQVTDGTLTTFCGAGDGFVRTWYDQSGNSRNATQATTTKQPLLVSSGSVVLQGTKPAFTFDDSVSKSLEITGLTGQNRLDAFAVKNSTSAGHLTFTAADSGGNFSWVAESGSADAGIEQWSTASPSLYVNGSLQSPANRGAVYTALNGYKLETTINGGTVAWPAFRIAGYGSIFAYGGTMQEVLIYLSDQSANRAAIETNINAHYAIY